MRPRWERELVRTLRDGGADWNATVQATGARPLSFAMDAGREDAVLALLADAGVSPLQLLPGGVSLARRAAELGMSRVVAWLREWQAAPGAGAA